MKTPAEWEHWSDAVWSVRKSYPTWHELITAVQQDARGETGTAAGHPATLAEALLAGVTAPDYGPIGGRRRTA
jgi:hypothetical protein